MTNYSTLPISAVSLNILSSLMEMISLIISFILLCFIIHRHISYNGYQWKFKFNIPFILSVYSLFLHIVKGLIQLLTVNFNTFKRDFHFHIIQDDTFVCRFSSYLYFSIVSTLYWNYVLQAFFRFTCILYSKCLWLHQSKIYLYLFIPTQILVSFLSILPLVFAFNSIHLIPDETYCSISMKNFLPLIYFFLIIICIPFLLVFILYLYLLHRIRLLFFRRQRNLRDYVVIQRILFLILILTMTAFPAIMNLMLHKSTDHLDLFVYRIQWLCSSLNSFIFIISLPFVNPQLCKLLKKTTIWYQV